MPTFSESIKEFINVAGLTARIKTLEAELALLKQLQSSLGGKKRGRKPGRPVGSANNGAPTKKVKRGKRGALGKSGWPDGSANNSASMKKVKRARRGRVKGRVLVHLKKNKEGRESEIAKHSGPKLGAINQGALPVEEGWNGHTGQKAGDSVCDIDIDPFSIVDEKT